MKLSKLITQGNYICLNSEITKQLGNLYVSTLFSEICLKYSYYQENDRLTEDGAFYLTTQHIKEKWGISVECQKTSLRKLEEMDLIKIDYRGIPKTRYITCKVEQINEWVSKTIGEVELNTSSRVTSPVAKSHVSRGLNITNNNTNKDLSVLSKDNTSKSSVDRRAATVSKTSQSKLFSSSKTPKTRKQATQKINTFIGNFEKECIRRGYPKSLLDKLLTYSRMLVEANCFLPQTSLKVQLDVLDKVPYNYKEQVVLETIEHGWKDLKYKADEYKLGERPSWDTAANCEVQIKTEEEKRVDIIAEAKARGEEIF